jgi:glutamate synthase (NADPH/NADH) small chain
MLNSAGHLLAELRRITRSRVSTTTSTAGLAREDATGAHDAVAFIRIRQEDLTTCRRAAVVVIGQHRHRYCGASASWAESVTLVYRRMRDMAPPTRAAVAQTNGVLIRTWARPCGVETDDTGVTAVTFEGTCLDSAGRLAGSGVYFTLQADQVFKAIGQKFSDGALQTDGLPADDLPVIENGRFRVDAERRTSLPGVWAGGDCIAGRDLTVVAVQDGKLAAESIHRELTAARADT